MKIGILVDGQAEYHSLPCIYEGIHTDATILRPRYCDIQPWSSPAAIAHNCMPALHILASKRPDLVVVLLDKEDRQDCTPAFVRSIEQHLQTSANTAGLRIQIHAVLKVRKFENWLIADAKAFLSLPQLFASSRRIRRAVTPDKADNVDAEALIRRCITPGRHYDKIHDSAAICAHLDPGRAALNSRSLRKLLRVLRDHRYLDQSRRPHRSPR